MATTDVVQALLQYGKQFDVDPRLLVAIAGQETSFATRMCSKDNAWNWFWCGVAKPPTCSDGDSVMAKCEASPFASWNEAIESVAHGLQRHYLSADRNTIAQIESKFCAEGCDSWANNVNMFYADLDGDPNDLRYSCRPTPSLIEQYGYWDQRDFVPTSDFTLATMRGYAACYGACPHLAKISVYAGDNPTPIATSDAAYVSWPGNCPPNSACSAEWTFTGANQATLHAGQTYHVGLDVFQPGGDYVMITVDSSHDPQRQYVFRSTAAPESIMGSLSASHADATQPPLTTAFTAAVTGGSAIGTTNFTLWWNCSDSSSDVASTVASCGDPAAAEIGAKFNNIPQFSVSSGHTYAAAGTYPAKLIIERGAAPSIVKSVPIAIADAEQTIWSEQPDHSVSQAFTLNARPALPLVNGTTTTLATRQFTPYYIGFPNASQSQCNLRWTSIEWYPNSGMNAAERLGFAYLDGIHASWESVPGGLLFTIYLNAQTESTPIIGPGYHFRMPATDCGGYPSTITFGFDNENHVSYFLGNARKEILDRLTGAN